MATSEPNIPLIISRASMRPLDLAMVKRMLAVPPPKEDIIVVTAAWAAYCHFVPLRPYVLPELNANQPHQSTNSPITAFTGFPGKCKELEPH